MSFAMTPVRPVYDDKNNFVEICPLDKTQLESHWNHCPDCGDRVDDMQSDMSDWLCDCSQNRMKRTAKPGNVNSRDEQHECEECGAIWIGLDWGQGDDWNRDPDKWNENKARIAFAAHLKTLYGFELPEKVSA